MLNTRWYFNQQNLSRSDKDSLEAVIRSSSIVRDILTKVIEHELEKSATNPVSDYSLPGWAYLQADKVGYDRALRLILEMTKLESDPRK